MPQTRQPYTLCTYIRMYIHMQMYTYVCVCLVVFVSFSLCLHVASLSVENILTATETNLRPGRKSRRRLLPLVNVKPELGFHIKNNR